MLSRRRFLSSFRSAAILPLAIPIPDEAEIRATEKRVFDLVNDDRTRARLSPLLWDDGLADAARSQSTRMMVRGFFGHYDPEYGDLGRRLHSAGIEWMHCSENIFHCTGWQDPTRIADISWMTSAGHRANMLGEEVTLSGVGIARRPTDNWFITQIFSAPLPPVARAFGSRRNTAFNRIIRWLAENIFTKRFPF